MRADAEDAAERNVRDIEIARTVEARSLEEGIEHHADGIGVALVLELAVALVDGHALRLGERDDDALGVSALSGQGLPQLRVAIVQALGAARIDDDEGLVQTARQEHALRECHRAVDDALLCLGDAPDEVVCSELRRAARCLDRLLGKDVSADVLDLVFSRFCIGK